MADSIYGLGALNTSTGTEKLVALKNRHFWVWNSGNDNWELQSGVGKYLTADTYTYHEEFLDYQFWCNGTDLNRTYNGSSWSLTANVTDSPIGTYPKVFQNKMYLGDITILIANGRTAFPSRVWVSNVPTQDANGAWTITWGFESGVDLATTASSAVVTSAGSVFKTRGIKVGDEFFITSGNNAKKYIVSSIDSETQITLTENVTNTGTGQYFWVGSNYFDINSNDGDFIKGLGDNSGRLLIFKQNSLHRWDGASPEQVKQVPGTTSHRSIVNLKDFTFYFHPTGVWRYNGVTAELISEPIWDVIEAISSSNYANVTAWTDNARFVKFYVGNTSANLFTDLPAITDCVLVYDITLDNWSLMSLAHSITVTAPWVESNAHKIYAGFSDGHVYQLETGTDFDGSAIPFRLRTKTYYPIAPEATVSGERMEEYTQGGQNLSIGYRRIRQPHPDDKDFRPISQAFPVHERELRGIDFEATESGTGASFLLEKLSMFYSGGKVER